MTDRLTTELPDYAALVEFLIAPLLDSPDTLRINCEYVRGKTAVLVRVAFGEADQGRVLGRGGRNIEAVRTVLTATAENAGQTARLEVFGSPRPEREDRDHHHRPDGNSPDREIQVKRPLTERPTKPRRLDAESQ
ncbi:KH domain-containing protein [Spirulina sp. CCNP1310]|uniref:KH domain-containing protein n=1 Tax=Spirulina sp. CCNP1310 TaxID=3110249 RepID=UPI002B21A58B|nr:KH domain-containing protein [Spirulina sp. CCNP1310]MEA5421132.1 KH domain-containing protein [Spirulina sp. CCNP1310]